MKFDLHMHSGYSADGELSCKELAQMAEDKGLSVISLTDHDLVKGIKEITEEAEKKNIRVIPGIECSTLLNGNPVHLLGYGIDPDDPYFVSLAEQIALRNQNLFAKRMEKMENRYGIHMEVEDILKEAGGKSPWFVYFDRLLQYPEIQSHPDFKEYLPGGKRSSPAAVNFYWDNCMPGSGLYVEPDHPDFFDTVKKIHEAGGLAIIAHPYNTFYQKPDLLEKAAAGGIDGLEAYSNYHRPEQNEWFKNWCLEHHLLITCGSDFHGAKKPDIEMGKYGLQDGSSYLEDFLTALEKER